MTAQPSPFTPKSRTQFVELMFLPDDGGLIDTPTLGSDTPSLGAVCPERSEYDISTPEGAHEYAEAVSKYAEAVETFDFEVDSYGDDVDDFVRDIERAFDNAEQPSLFSTFTNEDAHRAIDAAGILTGDEVVVMLRGDYDRLVGDGSACVFGSNGVCVHRECGLTRADWSVAESVNGLR